MRWRPCTPYDSRRCNRAPEATRTTGNVQSRYWIHLQATDSEDSDERLFLPPGQTELANDRHWQHNDNEVRQYVHGAIEEPYYKLIEAFGWVLQRPEGLDRLASKYTAEYCPDSVKDDYRHGNVACNQEFPCREDASVLKEDRDFRKAEGEVVDDKTRVECLRKESVNPWNPNA